MAQNRVQYQRGLSMLEFFDAYGSVERCEAGAGPRASAAHVAKAAGTASSAGRTGCTSNAAAAATSAAWSAAQSSTPALPLPSWFLAMHLMTQAKNNVSALELKRHLGVSYLTAWLLKHKLMQVMVDREQWRQLTGRVEIDDAYLGGEVHGAKAGRDSPNKIPFVVAVQTTESGHAILMCLSQPPFTKESIRDFAATSLVAPATSVSDGLGRFTAVRGMGILHEPHVTGGGAASVKNPAFLALNTMLGNIKTSLAGTYHAFGFRKYAHRYLGQVQYLFNRRFDLRAVLGRLARAASQAGPCPLRAVRAAESSC